jgi:integrase
MDSARICNPSQKEIAERQALSQQEQADIISHISNITNITGRLYMAFLMFTCMRPCEILGLRWDDLMNNRQVVYIKRDLVFVNGKTIIGDTKTEKSKRQFPISGDLLHYLGQATESTGYIFGKNGQPISSESVYRKMWRDIKKEIDVHGMTPYVGRHTYATNMSRAGIPIKTAMDLMGHTDERMLLRTYTHSNEEDLLAATNTMSSYFASLGSSSPNSKTQSQGM